MDDFADFEVASMNDDFVQALHDDISKLFTYDVPTPALKAAMTDIGSDWFVKNFEMRMPSSLHDALQSDEPPDFDYFLNTPSAMEMKKTGCSKIGG
jgi:hypothetical protein